ncbi:MAG: glycosyltransferase family 4 protein [Gammaproteobacteria bacterium]|nr:glycosyltransferase family 4 protein [Gammaproteobacteria bacterium]
MERKYRLMKTILHIIDTTGPGGAETVFIDIITHLPKDKYRSIVIIRGKGWVYEELCRRGVKPLILDAKGSFNWRYLKSLVGLIWREKVDLIQSHLLGSNVYCSLAGLITRKPVVATFHGAVDVGEKERLKGLKFGAINLGASSIIAVSDSLKRNIVERTPLKNSKTCVIYNGINTTDFRRPHSAAIRRQFGWADSDIIIGSLGNIRKAKAYDVLLQAAALLKERIGNLRFVIAGQGKGRLYDELLRFRDELELGEIVHFLGFNDDPAEFLSNLDLFLLSSTSEGFSIATIQAMAAGLPVIATRSGGPEEIISHKENGWLVEAGSAAEIACAIDRLIMDTVLRNTLSIKGQEHAKQSFDIQAMLDGYQNIYDRLMQ